jgi:hypothetical protein
MKLSTQRTLIAATLAAAFTGFTALSFAQGNEAPPAQLVAQHQAQRADMKPTVPGERMAKMQQRMADRQAHLKETLKITPEQEPAWNAFLARTAPEPRMERTGEREDWSKLTTPQRLDKMQARQAERAAKMTQRFDATRSFYAALSAEQQKVFDAQGHGFMRTDMHGKRGHGHHHKGGARGDMGNDAPMQPRS